MRKISEISLRGRYIVENPRGYAFVAFARSYEHTLGFDWGAALNKHSDFPTKYEWMEHCLNTFDRMHTGGDSTELTQAIIKDYRQALYATIVGGFTTLSLSDDKLFPKFDAQPLDSDIHMSIAYDEQGFAELEDASQMRTRLALVRQQLTQEQYTALELYVNGSADSLRDAVMVHMGGDTKTYNRIRRGMRTACKGLVLA